MRTNKEETAELGKIISDKLNLLKDKNKAAVIIPSQGFSQLDAPGNPFFDKQCSKMFEEAVNTHLDPQVERHHIEANINETEFAKAAVEVLLGMMEKD
jgi:uncharacterized protein (UPF0261 family)